MGDFVFIKLLNKYTEDSIIFDSRKSKSDGIVSFPIRNIPFKGSLEEAILMMRVGDSASFKISADSIFQQIPKEDSVPTFPAGSFFTFDIKLVKVMTMQQVQDEQQKNYEDYLKRLEEMKAERKGAETGLINEYISQNKVNAKPTSSGLYFIETKAGSGPKPQKGSKVAVNYTGKFLEDGSVFDSSDEHGKPFEFTLGKGEVIKGWDEALLMMKKGGKATLIIPSKLGYDSTGVQDPYSGRFSILPYTPLLFEVELMEIK
jgi:FKBP-type peptidyl-prolyl cis-trans isomerase FkpA